MDAFGVERVDEDDALLVNDLVEALVGFGSLTVVESGASSKVS
jgi:hypothetical protein